MAIKGRKRPKQKPQSSAAKTASATGAALTARTGTSLEKARRWLEEGMPDKAVTLCRGLLAKSPGNVECLRLMILSLRAQGRHAETLVYCRRWQQSAPRDGRGFFHEAYALECAGETDRAKDLYTRAVSLSPSLSQAYLNLGAIHYHDKAFDQAVETYRRLLEHEPDHAGAWSDLASSYRRAGHTNKALIAFKRAFELNPEDAGLHSNFGNFAADQHHYEVAIKHFSRSLQIDPARATVHTSLANCLSQQCRNLEAMIVAGRGVKLDPSSKLGRENYLFALNHHADMAPAQVAAEHRRWGAEVEQRYPVSSAGALKRPDGRRIRVGYLSGDFCSHSVHFFFVSLFTAHDRSLFEIFLYGHVDEPDDITDHYRRQAEHWRDILNLDDAAIVAQIARDNIDILVDLQGYTNKRNFIDVLARKPAPVQVSWLGYPNTTGLSRVDYKIVDPITDPPGHEAYYSEQLVRMDHGFLCYQPPPRMPDIDPDKLDGMAAGRAVTFGSFNNTNKIQPDMIRIWCRVLAEIPDAKLILKGRAFVEPATAERCYAMFEREGVARDRIRGIARLPAQSDHLKLYNQIDIALDTWPYNGTTTTMEALWMGVPVMTLQGDRHVQRVSSSILHRIGLADLIATSPDEYVRKTVALARDWQRLKSLQTGMRERILSSPLMDKQGFARQMEKAFGEMVLAGQEDG